MGKKKKIFLGLIGLIVLWMVIRSVMSGGDDVNLAVKEQAPLVEISSPGDGSPTTESQADSGTQSFSGSGDLSISDVIINSGVLILSAQHEGAGDFSVSLAGADSTQNSFKTSGNFSGSVAHSVYQASKFGTDHDEAKIALTEESIFEILEPGTVSIEVTASGPWTIDILQETPSIGQLPPFSWESRGYAVVKWIDFPGKNFELTMEHTGSEIFQTYLLRSDGSHTEMLVDVPGGTYQGSRLLSFQEGLVFGTTPGLYALAVVADGEWSISVR